MKRNLGIGMLAASAAAFVGLGYVVDAMSETLVWASVIALGAMVYKGVNLWFD